jgi:large subunit ribosomal protein L19
MNLIDKVLAKISPKREHADFSTGDTITVSVKVKEGEKERIQLFKGTVIKVQGSGVGRSFTVRKVSDGVGVERTWPFASPAVDSIQVNLRGKVRRSRIYYLRDLKGRAARLTTEIVQQEKSADSVAKKLKKKAKADAAAAAKSN